MNSWCFSKEKRTLSFQHVKCKANSVADIMANKGVEDTSLLTIDTPATMDHRDLHHQFRILSKKYLSSPDASVNVPSASVPAHTKPASCGTGPIMHALGYVMASTSHLSARSTE
jgi:hypothetical protein